MKSLPLSSVCMQLLPLSFTPAQVQSQVNPHGICGGLSVTGTGLSQSTFVFPCQYISFVAVISFISLCYVIPAVESVIK